MLCYFIMLSTNLKLKSVLDTLKMLVVFEFNIIANCIVFEIIEKQWQLPKEVVNHQLPLKKRKLDL